tara:strand:+ start:450 stop:785 length:336 start_codon:yes stop_codon:yes gene_type:complete
MNKSNKSALTNFSTLIFGIFSIYISYITATGDILNYINFADPLNEMFFCFSALIMGVMCIYCGIPTRHFRKLRNKLFPFTISFKINIEKRYHPSGIHMKAWKNYTNKNKNQ